MSSNEIRETWERHRHEGRSVNINCGYLRGIGKTQFLRELMIEWKRDHPTSRIYLWSRNNRNITNQYRDLQNSNVIYEVGEPRICESIADVFADEWPEAENYCRDRGYNFVAGAYSYLVQESQVLRASENVGIGPRNIDREQQRVRHEEIQQTLQIHGFDTLANELNQLQESVRESISGFIGDDVKNKPKRKKKELADQKAKMRFIQNN